MDLLDLAIDQEGRRAFYPGLLGGLVFRRDRPELLLVGEATVQLDPGIAARFEQGL